MGVCNREEVRVKMFSGEKVGRVVAMKRRAETKRMLSERETAGGRGIGFEWFLEAFAAAARRDL